ncbi:MAG TPA: chemotaxis protein CheW [Candidatus Acidoferrales bacterium]|nr:chemotaxis protein CheW [Candidatus Acidoferrales bacterium]
MAKDIQIVGLRIGRETYGIPIGQVREIVRVPEITAVPNAQEYVEGVINLRGRIVSVVDLRKRFGESNLENNKKSRVVVVEIADRTVGLIVNSASEVLKLPPSEIAPPSSVFLDGEVEYVTGVGKLGNRLIILLDLEKTLKGGELHHPLQPAAPVTAT